MVPGSHFAVLSRDFNSGLRTKGLELRDTFLIMVPGTFLYLFLFRVPLEGTVVSQVLKTGTGGLNIDGARIQSGIRQATAGFRTIEKGKGWGVGQGGSGYVKGTGAQFTKTGRWPSNLLLVHDYDCVYTGTKKVQNIGGSSSGCSAFGQELGWNSHNNRPTYIERDRDEDGLETVQAWDCVPGCSVLILDSQSGTSISTGGGGQKPGVADGTHIFGKFGRRDLPPNVGKGDMGGASRFYPQFKNLGEAVDWVQRLAQPLPV